MDRDGLSDDSPASLLFPEFATLYDLIASEVYCLTEEQLDYESQQWDWSRWGIRRQLCHMAWVPVGWLTVNWGDTLFPDGSVRPEHFKTRTESSLPKPVIMKELRASIGLVQNVLTERSVGFLRDRTYTLRWDPDWNDSMDWNLMLKAHATGLSPTDDPRVSIMTLEATIRHLYFEEITHLYNIQRIKRAQGLTPVIDLSQSGILGRGRLGRQRTCMTTGGAWAGLPANAVGGIATAPVQTHGFSQAAKCSDPVK